MKIFELRAFNIESLICGERPAPTPGPGEVAIRMRAASVNYRDLALARGDYDPSLRLPIVPLSDGAGEVLAVGPGVTRAAVGDRVSANYILDWTHGPPLAETTARRLGGPLDGVLAEIVVVPEHAIVHIPPEIGDEEAATLPIAAVTAYRGLFTVARIRPGDVVVVEGTGGVSLFALQLAVAAGAQVVVVGSRPDKLARARALGAFATIDAGAEPAWHERVQVLTGGRGADVVVEVVGGDNLARAAGALRVGGAILLVGFLRGYTASLDVRPLLRRQAAVHALSVGSREDFEALVRAMVATRLRPVIDRALPFAEAPEALAYLARGEHFGKVVIRFP